jgi:hypothetical protein
VIVAAKIRIGVSWFPDPTFKLRRQYSANWRTCLSQGASLRYYPWRFGA